MPNAQGRLRLLIVDDSEDDTLLLLRHFRTAGYRCEHERVDTRDAMREALRQRPWDAVLSDHRMPRFSALGALDVLHELDLDLPFIIVSGVIDEETAVAAMRAGAHDYLGKGRLDRLVPALERELREAGNRAERRSALDAVRESEERYRALVANIPGMVFQMAHAADAGWCFLYASEGTNAVLGMRPDELVSSSQRFFERIPEEDRSRLAAALSDSHAALGAVNWEGRVGTPEGGRKWINLRASPRHAESGAVVWDGAMFNITQSKDTEIELRRSREQLAELSSHLEADKEEERERIARDIHDELGGTLVALKFELALLAAKAPPELTVRAATAGRLADEAIATAGRVARALRPGILKDFGLAAAIECQAEDFAQRTGIACEVVCADHDIAPGAQAATALFRIFQEALTNVGKHAHATRIEVRLAREAAGIVLEVIDDGCGIQPADLAKPKSYGLRGMRERLHGLGGSLEIDRAEPCGTRLRVRAPANAAEAGATRLQGAEETS